MAGGKLGPGRPKKKYRLVNNLAKHNDSNKTCIGGRGEMENSIVNGSFNHTNNTTNNSNKTCIGGREEMDNSIVNGSFNHTNNTTSSSGQMKKAWATRRVIESTKSCRTSTRPVLSRDMYDAVPACSKTISERNARSHNGTIYRLHGIIRQKYELVHQLKDEADHANVLMEEHNREQTFWMKETVKKEAELEMINDEVQIAKKNAELTKNDFKLLGDMFDLELSSFMNEEEKSERLMKVIKKIFTQAYPRKGNIHNALKMMELVAEKEMFGAYAGQFSTIKISQAYMRMVVEPWRVLRLLDCESEGACSQSAVDRLGHVEKFGKGSVGYKHGQSAITPKRSITYARAQLNLLIQHNMKVVCNDDPQKSKHGDHMYVNIDDSIRHMTKGLGIYVLAQRLNMECCLSSDGADFTRKGRGHTTMGLKFTELSAIDPDTGELLLVSTDENGKEYYRNTQSLKYITICETIESPETKVVVKDVCFPFYRNLNRLAKVGIPASDGWEAIKPLIMRVTCDTKTAWGIVGNGGPLKNRTFACHCCPARKEQDLFAVRLGANVCNRYCKKYGRTTCRHREISIPEVVERETNWLFSEIIQDMKRLNGNYHDWRTMLPEQSIYITTGYTENQTAIELEVYLQSEFDIANQPTQKIKHYLCHLMHSEETTVVLELRKSMYSTPEQFDKELDKKHVDFQPDTSNITAFNERVFANLISRGYKNSNLRSQSAAERLKLLKHRLSIKRRIQQIRNMLEVEEIKSKHGCVGIEHVVSCILHLENRSGEGIILCAVK